MTHHCSLNVSSSIFIIPDASHVSTHYKIENNQSNLSSICLHLILSFFFPFFLWDFYPLTPILIVFRYKKKKKTRNTLNVRSPKIKSIIDICEKIAREIGILDPFLSIEPYIGFIFFSSLQSTTMSLYKNYTPKCCQKFMSRYFHAINSKNIRRGQSNIAIFSLINQIYRENGRF